MRKLVVSCMLVGLLAELLPSDTALARAGGQMVSRGER